MAATIGGRLHGSRFAIEGKTINAADNFNPEDRLDIVKASETGAGNSADYLTARLKRGPSGSRFLWTRKTVITVLGFSPAQILR
jgi:hypothetical protein